MVTHRYMREVEEGCSNKMSCELKDMPVSKSTQNRRTSCHCCKVGTMSCEYCYLFKDCCSCISQCSK